MREIDPYLALAVPRTATREEIARAYRRLAKQHHPDAGAPPSPTMARINEAWHTLSDPARRTAWDRSRALALAPPHHASVRPATVRPTSAAAEPPSVRDSGWLAVGIVGLVGILITIVMVGVSVASQQAPPTAGPRFSDADLSFEHPAAWSVYQGTGDDPAGHRVIAHVATFDLEPSQLCTSFADPCDLTGSDVPSGAASILIAAWAGGPPPVPDPLYSRAYGLDADRFIGGEPAAFELRRGTDSAIAWWQLSPPGFPDRWIEVRATVGGRAIEQMEMLEAIEGMLATVAFGE